MEHFQKAVKLNPQSKPDHNVVINFYLDHRKWDDPEKLVSAALEAAFQLSQDFPGSKGAKATLEM